jgi:hypothetical protein
MIKLFIDQWLWILLYKKTYDINKIYKSPSEYCTQDLKKQNLKHALQQKKHCTRKDKNTLEREEKLRFEQPFKEKEVLSS